MKTMEPPKYLSTWVTNIPPHIKLRHLILPGSHASNSSTIYKPKLGIPFMLSQTISVGKQLRAGIRFFDLKFGVRKDKIYDMLKITK
jgi:1-phosphatidylinositol phosphodiesterase